MVGITYFPSKYWATAVPSGIVITIFSLLITYMVINILVVVPPTKRKSL
jgi:phosphatidylinositol glycan class P protein